MRFGHRSVGPQNSRESIRPQYDLWLHRGRIARGITRLSATQAQVADGTYAAVDKSLILRRSSIGQAARMADSLCELSARAAPPAAPAPGGAP